MALNYETLIRAASKSPEQRTTAEINEVIFPWLKQSLKKKQGIFQKISDGKLVERFDRFEIPFRFRCYSRHLPNRHLRETSTLGRRYSTK